MELVPPAFNRPLTSPDHVLGCRQPACVEHTGQLGSNGKDRIGHGSERVELRRVGDRIEDISEITGRRRCPGEPSGYVAYGAADGFDVEWLDSAAAGEPPRVARTDARGGGPGLQVLEQVPQSGDLLVVVGNRCG